MPSASEQFEIRYETLKIRRGISTADFVPPPNPDTHYAEWLMTTMAERRIDVGTLASRIGRINPRIDNALQIVETAMRGVRPGSEAGDIINHILTEQDRSTVPTMIRYYRDKKRWSNEMLAGKSDIPVKQLLEILYDNAKQPQVVYGKLASALFDHNEDESKRMFLEQIMNKSMTAQDVQALTVYDAVINGSSPLQTPGELLHHVMDKIYHISTGELATRGTTDKARLHASQVSNWRGDKAIKPKVTTDRNLPSTLDKMAQGLGYEEDSLLRGRFLQAMHVLARKFKGLKTQTVDGIFEEGVNNFSNLIRRARLGEIDANNPLALMSIESYQKSLRAQGVIMGIENIERGLFYPDDYNVRAFAQLKAPHRMQEIRDLAVRARTGGKTLDDIIFSPQTELEQFSDMFREVKPTAEFVRQHLQSPKNLSAHLARRNFNTVMHEVLNALDISEVKITDAINVRRKNAEMKPISRTTMHTHWAGGRYDKGTLDMMLDELQLSVPQREQIEELWKVHHAERGR